MSTNYNIEFQIYYNIKQSWTEVVRCVTQILILRCIRWLCKNLWILRTVTSIFTEECPVWNIPCTVFAFVSCCCSQPISAVVDVSKIISLWNFPQASSIRNHRNLNTHTSNCRRDAAYTLVTRFLFKENYLWFLLRYH